MKNLANTLPEPTAPGSTQMDLLPIVPETLLAQARRLDTDGSLRRRRQLVDDNRLL